MLLHEKTDNFLWTRPGHRWIPSASQKQKLLFWLLCCIRRWHTCNLLGSILNTFCFCTSMKKVSLSCWTAATMLGSPGFHARNKNAFFLSFVVDAALFVRTSHTLWSGQAFIYYYAMLLLMAMTRKVKAVSWALSPRYYAEAFKLHYSPYAPYKQNWTRTG